MKIIFTALMASILMFASTSYASAEDFDYTEINTFVKHKDSGVTLGYRTYENKDKTHFIFRKDFDEKYDGYRAEYRYVENGNLHEHWLRVQIKAWSNGGYFYNHRFEHRDREAKYDVLRYRPQFGYMSQTNYGGLKPFVVFEPHWQHSYKEKDTSYSHMQTFIGAEYRVLNNFKIVPQVEIDLDKNFKKEVAHFVVDFKFEF